MPFGSLFGFIISGILIFIAGIVVGIVATFLPQLKKISFKKTYEIGVEPEFDYKTSNPAKGYENERKGLGKISAGDGFKTKNKN